MNWNHVQLIFLREMMDQLRDRRTLFTITILPLLLYPLLGMLLMQVSQFHRESVVRIGVIGDQHWPEQYPLWNSQGKLVSENGQAGASQLIEFELSRWPEMTDDEIQQQARRLLRDAKVDAVLIVSSDFSSRLSAQNQTLDPAAEDQIPSDSSPDPVISRSMTPGLSLVTNLARDQSSIAASRLSSAVESWWDGWRTAKLAAAGFPETLSAPIRMDMVDTSVSSVRQAVRWSKILPFVMLVWALTGAFYPAVDLCAGEKERGTLETLLSSPARRREIVWGKLLTINVFSVMSALLNLTSMQITAGMVVRSLSANNATAIAETLGTVPPHALGWLILLLIPMSAFFSALALAIAALAKSTKEGQYYLMPLLLVTLPLVALPMIPSMEMNLGTSLIPVSGAVFLVRSLIEGRYAEAVIHLPVVVAVTLFCCWLATRWAIRQFESETVMFHESGRWDVRIWLRHLWRDRQDTAIPSVALMCGALILVARFFAQFFVGSDPSFIGVTLLVQVGLILTPCLLMALLLTRHPRRALRIHRTQWSHVLAAVLIGFSLHPSYQILGQAIVEVYPISQETLLMLKQFESIVFEHPLWLVLLLLAAVPAVCEELAFRGFIFGGLLRKQGVLRAIIVSSLLFGFTHAILQQSITASLMGLMLGLIAWRTGGVFCTIIVHAISNTLTLTMAWCGKNGMTAPMLVKWAIEDKADGWAYSPQWQFISIMLSVSLLLILFQRSRQTQEVVMAEMA
jgi:sodium transport system permease protein